MQSLIRFIQERRSDTATRILFFLAALQAFLGPLDLADASTRMVVGLDKTVACKLVLAGLMAVASVWGLWNFSEVRNAIMTIPGTLVMLLLGMTLVGGTSGLTGAALPTSLINISTFIFVITILTVAGPRIFSLAIVLGSLGTAGLGLYLFYFVPESGVFLEPIEGGQFLGRLGGAAHPNSVARSSIMAILLTVYLSRTKEFSVPVTLTLIFVLGWAFVLAKSRTAFIAGGLGLLLLYSDRLRSRRAIGTFVMLTVLGLASVFALFAVGKEQRLVEKVVGLVAKSGSLQELTTATGRTDIWAEASKFVAQRPLTGWGLNSGPALLPNHSQATHNAVMNASLSGGIFAGLAMLCLQLWLIWTAFQSPHLLVRGVAIFLFFSCLTEDTVMETFPGPCTMMWYMCLIYPVLSYSPINSFSRRSFSSLPTPKMVVAGE